MDHTASQDFAEGLAPVNAVADTSPGFVWRLQGDDGNATSISAFENPLTIVNLTVWESLESLRDFAYRGLHRDFLRRRAEWFGPGSSAALWWVPAGTMPTVSEATTRLDFLNEFGPSPYSFEMGQRFPQVVVVRRSLADPDVTAMLQQLDRELVASTPQGGSNFLHIAPDHVDEGSGGLFVAFADGVASACGAYRLVDGELGVAEVKRMWVDRAQRGTKLGAAVLRTIESAARADGFRELRLETGEHLTAAIGLYRRFGFEACPGWGEYASVEHSYTMSKQLV